MVKRFTLIRPDDWHLHLRDGAMMAAALPDTARHFARAIVMPNLQTPITTVDLAQAYRDRILAALPADMRFEPLMTLYLTDNMPVSEIAKAKNSGFVQAIKYYPTGATTHSEHGVTDLKRAYSVLAAMEKLDLPLLLHGEVTDSAVDMFDREAVFIDRHLMPLTRDFPGLRMVLEHITTRAAVDFVRQAPNNVAATITAHHLLLNRNALFEGGLQPHHYCLPLLKRETQRAALVDAATSGNPKFFLGTDSAPHSRQAKESACGCAGIYTGHAAMELYTEIFERAGALDRLEAFASFHGSDFYRLPRNRDTLTLEQRSWTVPEELYFGKDTVVPLRAGKTMAWTVLT
ncbi:dihydroorotase [Acidithiobacillus sp. 'AMD consortium']|uniref:Dihydroorotase n=1 Tax=Acidithiobacillus ferrooxidans TaxID=920 RepID=A0A2W1KFG1_ACIFR|nr:MULTISPECIES: dihydroorotase [Acidithiobacillus]ACH83602.1 dihydroorotase, homodimeric type [Acidithiobacillus ferrooxidans ATCC 53993]MBU2774414.1 dihydroorotase [Acidithiobacillus ferrooxidans]MBU2809745.1 dihydroorotase [Acidithiobacillus ferrooxidans F221]MBU2817383.1 dihydroorotase [Acidithiobacillus ferrooxidans]MCR1341612.1 dihydroorotase [Acidithiobacillus ferrooxidans]